MNKEMEVIDVEEKAKAIRRAAAKEYYKKNRAEIRKKRRMKRQENLQEQLEKERQYRANNPDKVKKWIADYWKRKAEKEMDKDA